MGLQSLGELPEESKKILYNRYLAFQIIFPLIGGLLFGYNTGVISGALLLLKKEFLLSVYLQEVVVTATVVACAISSIIGGILAEKFGRKATIICSSFLMICGAMVMGMASNISVVILGRVIVGFGIGVAGTACPIYIAEVAPEEIRGRLIVIYQITIAGGQFIAAIVNALFNYHDNNQMWRYMLGFPALPAFIQAFGLIFIPESHRWLLSKNKTSKAKKIIRKEGRVPEEFIDEYVDDILIHNEEIELPIKGENLQHRTILYQIFHDKIARQSLIIGCGIQMIQQIIGINAVVYYSSSILNMAGIIDNQSVLWYTVLIMFFLFAPLIIGYFLIDRIGRRKLAMLSLAGIILSCIILAIGFQVMYATSVPVKDKMPLIIDNYDVDCFRRKNCEACVTMHTCGFCSIDNGTKSYCLTINITNLNYSRDGQCSYQMQKNTTGHFRYGYCEPHYYSIILLGMMLYFLSFASGMGPVPWTVTSEIYPLWCRGINMAISSTVNWLFNILISMTFLSLTEWISRYGAFWLFGGVSLCSLGLIYKWLPETNQLTLEEVNKLIENN